MSLHKFNSPRIMHAFFKKAPFSFILHMGGKIGIISYGYGLSNILAAYLLPFAKLLEWQVWSNLNPYSNDRLGCAP